LAKIIREIRHRQFIVGNIASVAAIFTYAAEELIESRGLTKMRHQGVYREKHPPLSLPSLIFSEEIIASFINARVGSIQDVLNVKSAVAPSLALGECRKVVKLHYSSIYNLFPCIVQSNAIIPWVLVNAVAGRKCGE
jgi:hypothetical protein